MTFHSIDIFCHVIDNYGDAGFVYRFATEMKLAHPSCRIRVFIDNVAVPAAVDQRVVSGFTGNENPLHKPCGSSIIYKTRLLFSIRLFSDKQEALWFVPYLVT
jgi:hypothetical protein